MAGQGVAGPGVAWFGLVRHGEAWQGAGVGFPAPANSALTPAMRMNTIASCRCSHSHPVRLWAVRSSDPARFIDDPPSLRLRGLGGTTTVAAAPPSAATAMRGSNGGRPSLRGIRSAGAAASVPRRISITSSRAPEAGAMTTATCSRCAGTVTSKRRHGRGDSDDRGGRVGEMSRGFYSRPSWSPHGTSPRNWESENTHGGAA
jgi:hypothetical protein